MLNVHLVKASHASRTRDAEIVAEIRGGTKASAPLTQSWMKISLQLKPDEIRQLFALINTGHDQAITDVSLLRNF